MINQSHSPRQSGIHAPDNEIVVVRGFDLFFKNTSLYELQSIAKDLGGNSRFEFIEQRATYMFENAYCVPVTETKKFHEVLHALGNSLASKHGGDYYASEIYLSTKYAALRTISQQVEVVSIKTNLSK